MAAPESTLLLSPSAARVGLALNRRGRLPPASPLQRGAMSSQSCSGAARREFLIRVACADRLRRTLLRAMRQKIRLLFKFCARFSRLVGCQKMASDIKEKKMKDEVRTRHFCSIAVVLSRGFLRVVGCLQSNMARAHQEGERAVASQRGVSPDAKIK